MIDRKISIHLQDFPSLDFVDDAADLVKNMDLVRLICSSALSIRDNKNLRVRLPLSNLKIIGKNISQILEFKDIIAEEVNVKNVEIVENLDEIADLKLQLNFKKIGAKYGSKIKELTNLAKNGDFVKISQNQVKIGDILLENDEFELKLVPKDQNLQDEAIVALPDNSCLISLNTKITESLEQEGIYRDIVRAIQQARKDANLDVSDRVKLQIFAQNDKIIASVKEFINEIKDQVLASEIKVAASQDEVKNSTDFSCASKIEDGEIFLGIKK